jgi:hypothetical protein
MVVPRCVGLRRVREAQAFANLDAPWCPPGSLNSEAPIRRRLTRRMTCTTSPTTTRRPISGAERCVLRGSGVAGWLRGPFVESAQMRALLRLGNAAGVNCPIVPRGPVVFRAVPRRSGKRWTRQRRAGTRGLRPAMTTRQARTPPKENPEPVHDKPYGAEGDPEIRPFDFHQERRARSLVMTCRRIRAVCPADSASGTEAETLGRVQEVSKLGDFVESLIQQRRQRSMAPLSGDQFVDFAVGRSNCPSSNCPSTPWPAATSSTPPPPVTPPRPRSRASHGGFHPDLVARGASSRRCRDQ